MPKPKKLRPPEPDPLLPPPPAACTVAYYWARLPPGVLRAADAAASTDEEVRRRFILRLPAVDPSWIKARGIVSFDRTRFAVAETLPSSPPPGRDREYPELFTCTWWNGRWAWRLDERNADSFRRWDPPPYMREDVIPAAASALFWGATTPPWWRTFSRPAEEVTTKGRPGKIRWDGQHPLNDHDHVVGWIAGREGLAPTLRIYCRRSGLQRAWLRVPKSKWLRANFMRYDRYLRISGDLLIPTATCYMSLPKPGVGAGLWGDSVQRIYSYLPGGDEGLLAEPTDGVPSPRWRAAIEEVLDRTAAPEAIGMPGDLFEPQEPLE